MSDTDRLLVRPTEAEQIFRKINYIQPSVSQGDYLVMRGSLSVPLSRYGKEPCSRLVLTDTTLKVTGVDEVGNPQRIGVFPPKPGRTPVCTIMPARPHGYDLAVEYTPAAVTSGVIAQLNL